MIQSIQFVNEISAERVAQAPDYFLPRVEYASSLNSFSTTLDSLRDSRGYFLSNVARGQKLENEVISILEEKNVEFTDNTHNKGADIFLADYKIELKNFSPGSEKYIRGKQKGRRWIDSHVIDRGANVLIIAGVDVNKTLFGETYSVREELEANGVKVLCTTVSMESKHWAKQIRSFIVSLLPSSLVTIPSIASTMYHAIQSILPYSNCLFSTVKLDFDNNIGRIKRETDYLQLGTRPNQLSVRGL